MLARAFSFDPPPFLQNYFENLPKEILADIIELASVQGILNVTESSKELHDRIWEIITGSYQSFLIFTVKILNYSTTSPVKHNTFFELLENLRNMDAYKQLKEKTNKSLFELAIYTFITDDVRNLIPDKLFDMNQSPVKFNPRLTKLFRTILQAVVYSKYRNPHNLNYFLELTRGNNTIGLNLNGIDLSDTYLSDANFIRANLCNANLTKSILSDCRLSGINSKDTIFQNCIFYHSLFVDSNLINCDLVESRFYNCVLGKAKLNHSNCSNICFFESNAHKADFSNTNLYFAIFKQCKLVNANFSDANLSFAKFINCDLSGIDLSNANLSGITMQDCNFSNIKFIKFDLNNLHNDFHQSLTKLYNQIKTHKMKNSMKMQIINDVKKQLTHFIEKKLINYHAAIIVCDQIINHDFFQESLYKFNLPTFFVSSLNKYLMSDYQKNLIEFKENLIEQIKQQDKILSVHHM